MKNTPTDKNSKNQVVKTTTDRSDKTKPDKGADKTGTDTDADKTKNKSTEKGQSENKFDKPKRETDPDRTGIDINPDKTTKENSSTTAPVNTDKSK